MNNKKLLLAIAALLLFCIICISALVITIFLIEKEPVTIENNEEAAELLTNSFEKLFSAKERRDNKIYVEFKVMDETNGFTFAIDNKDKKVYFRSGNKYEAFATQDDLIYCKNNVCTNENLEKYEDVASLFPNELLTNYDQVLDYIANEFLPTASFESFSEDNVTYEYDTVSCGKNSKCFVLKIDDPMTKYFIETDTNRIIEIREDESDMKVNIKYNFDIEVPNLVSWEEFDKVDKRFIEERNKQRESDLNEILEAVTQYLLEKDNSIEDFKNIKDCREAIYQTSIGTVEYMVNLEDLLVSKYLNKIPSDPSESNSEDTGYDICISKDGEIVISAPNAENNAFVQLQ